MKKIILFVLLLLFLVRSFGQQSTETTLSNTKADYLRKSKNQKKVGWIMLGGGATLIVVAKLIPPGEFIQPDDPSVIFLTKRKNDGVIAAFFVTGTLSMLGSIPFFITSGKNKRRAASLSFNNMMMPQIKNSSMVYQPMPAVSLKINL